MNNRGEIKVRFGTVVSILIILGLVIVGAYLLYSNNIKINDLEKELSKQKEFNVAQKEESNKAKANSEKNLENKIDKFVVPSLETAKAKNTNHNGKYLLEEESSKIFGTVIENGVPYITFKGNLNQCLEMLNISLNESKIAGNSKNKITGFSKKVVEIKEGLFGQQLVGTCLLFLMEDGTVEYSTIENIFKNLTTQGKIEKLENIVKFQSVSVTDLDENGNPQGGCLSTIAIDKDNYYYDIEDYIPEHNQ